MLASLRVTTATRYYPVTVMWLPAGGHENCPVAATGFARHDIRCLTASGIGCPVFQHRVRPDGVVESNPL